MTCLTTERLTLRLWQESDLPAMLAFFSDPAACHYIGGVKSPEQCWRHIATYLGHWQLRGFGYWLVEVTSNGDFVGSVGLWKSQQWPELELGYWLSPQQQGKGYAVEAAICARDWARTELKAPTLVSYIAPNNTPSIKVAKRLGARYETAIDLADFGVHQVYRHF